MDSTIDGYKHLGAIALGLFWLFTVIMVARLRLSHEKSISQHAASTKKVAILFGTVTLFSSFLLILFFIRWFTPTFQLGIAFNIVITLSFALYVVAGVIPDVKGIRHKIHVRAAIVASVLLLPAMVMVLSSNLISQSARVFAAFAIFAMLYIVIRFTLQKRQNFLIYQVLYFLCFDISVLVATYV